MGIPFDSNKTFMEWHLDAFHFFVKFASPQFGGVRYVVFAGGALSEVGKARLLDDSVANAGYTPEN